MAALPAPIDADRKRFIRDSRRAAALQKDIDKYRAERSGSIERWTNIIRTLMAEHQADDPVEILPQVIVAAEEHLFCEVRKQGQAAARDELRRLLRKATTS
jgi:hypothetical protein